MATNFDKLLKRIERNSEIDNNVKVHTLHIADEDFEVKTFTRKEKRNFIYAMSTDIKNAPIGDIVKIFKPFIYRALGLSTLATKAKDEGYIKAYHDVVEALFEPEEILEIITFITEINNLTVGAENVITEEINDIKKQ